MPTNFTQEVDISTVSALTMQRTTAAIESQNMTVAPSFTQAWAWGRTLLEAIHIHPTDSEGLTYHLTLAQAAHLADLFARTIPLTLAQNMTIGQAAAFALSISLLQGIAIQAQHAPVGNVILGLNESVTLTPGEVLQAIYNGTLTETVDMGLLFLNPNGTTTTWAVNTRTNAITEYTNYNFNSFAQRGLRYMAANSTGIYELDGDSDNGTDINIDILSGFMQPNGSKLSGFKNIYIAIRGEGLFVLKLIAGDGREYVYELKSQPNLMKAKINVGKGLRSNYWAWQLISQEGVDLDLDSLEFIPMLSDRRV